MALLSRIEDRQKPAWDDFWYQPITGSTNAGIDVGPREAMSSTAMWNACWLVSVLLGSLPLKLYRYRDDGGREQARDHPLFCALSKRPNQWMPAVRYRATSQLHLMLYGNTISQKLRNRREEVVGLLPLHPTRFRIFTDRDADGNEVLRYLYYRPNGATRAFTREDVLHITGLSPDGILGWSPIDVNCEAIATTLAVERHAAAYYRNNTKLAGLIKVPGGKNLEKPKKEELRAEWQRAYSGEKAYSTAILEYGLEYQEISGSARDAELLGHRTYQIQEVSRITGVPPPFLAELSRATFSNIEELGQWIVRYLFTPWSVIWEQSMECDLLTPAEQEQYFVKHSMEALLRGDHEARAKFYQAMRGMGVYSTNDILRKEDEDPVEGGDRRFIPMNWQPLDAVDAMLELDPEEYPQGDPEEENSLEGRRALALPATTEARARQHRSVQGRVRHRQNFHPIFVKNADRAVKREVRAARRALEKSRSRRDLESFREWVETFYGEFAKDLFSIFQPVFFTYAAEIAGEVAQELGTEEDLSPTVESFMRRYSATYATRYARKSRAELRHALEAEDAAEAEARVERVLQRWEETRAEVESNRETVRTDGAVARAIYVFMGVKMRWLTMGESCPLCDSLDGVVVSGSDPFVKAGDTVAGGADQEDLVASKNYNHGPLHNGCDCMVVADL